MQAHSREDNPLVIQSELPLIVRELSHQETVRYHYSVTSVTL